MKKGFTIIEMLIVVTIIAVLAGLILRGMGGALPRSRDARRLGDLKNIQNMLELYYTKHNTYPTDLDTLANDLSTTLPKDPSTGSPYCYTASNPTLDNTIYNGYILGAQLEITSSTDSITGSCGGKTCGQNLFYCVGM